MAYTMQFDLVSPERSLASVPVREVRLPGSDGDLTAMPGHAPTIVTLRPGMVILVAPTAPPANSPSPADLPRSTRTASACWPSAVTRARRSRRTSTMT